MEETVDYAEEDQVAGSYQARVGCSRRHGEPPGDLTRMRVHRSVNAVIHHARYIEGSCKCARLRKRAVHIIRRAIRDSEIRRQIPGMRVDEVGAWTISRRRPFHSSVEDRLVHQWRWLPGRPL